MKDQDEIKSEKEEKTQNMNTRKDKLTNQLKQLNSEIAKLEDQIFNSAEYLQKKQECEDYIAKTEVLIKDEKFNVTKSSQLEEMKNKLTNVNNQLVEEQVNLKLDIQDKTASLTERQEGFKKEFEKKIKSLSTKELNEAKERKSIRSTKNNELEEQYNIRKIEMRKQRDKLINEVDEKRELQNQ